jgi:hypothetical protein
MLPPVKEAAIPITPFLSGQVLSLKRCSTCRRPSKRFATGSGLTIRHDPATDLVAKTIIKLAQQGVREVDALLKAALKEFDLDK